MKKLAFILCCVFLLTLLTQAENAQAAGANASDECQFTTPPVLNDDFELISIGGFGDDLEEVDGIIYRKKGGSKASPITGIVCRNYESGKLERKAQFKNGKPEGIEKDYYPSGELESEVLYKNGMREGIRKSYYKSGKLMMEQTYIEGKQEGILKNFYESGRLMSELQFTNDEPDGIFKQYYESGRLKSELPVTSGMRRKEGQMIIYRENGKQLATIEYKYNSPVNGMCHHTNGTKTPLTNAELTNWKKDLPFECE